MDSPSPSRPPTPFSPDGRWFWTGSEWHPAASSDGAWIWDGWTWRPAVAVASGVGQASSTPRTLIVAAVAMCTVVALIALAVGRSRSPAARTLPAPAQSAVPPTTAPSGEAQSLYPAAPTGTQVFDEPDRSHTSGSVDYDRTPPAGGEHDPVWLNCGIYDAPVRSENAVHSLEHGAVWVTYRPDLGAAEVARIRDAVPAAYRTPDRYVILSPYPDLPGAVVASGWGVQLRLEAASDPRLAQFLDVFVHGPQRLEDRSPCRGGLGTPMDGQAGPGAVTAAWQRSAPSTVRSRAEGEPPASRALKCGQRCQ